jgi:hypothetical protein
MESRQIRAAECHSAPHYLLGKDAQAASAAEMPPKANFPKAIFNHYLIGGSK